MIWLLAGIVLVSAALTWVLRGYALRRGILDLPNQRSSHSVATPRGGGLAIVVTYLGALTGYYLSGRIGAGMLLASLAAGGLVAAIGYLDDHGHVPARWRILVHFIAAAMALFWIGAFPPVPFGDYPLDLGWLGYPIAAIFLVWMLNLYNFMDGIDGIAGVEAVCVAGSAVAVYVLHAGSNAPWDEGLLFPLLALSAACIGFLLWNWPPAKIFMGDVGSSFIGFVLGLFALIGSAFGQLSIWTWLILLALFLVDATMTLIRRFIRGDRWFEAHRSHAYQHAALRWKSHRRVTVSVMLIDVVWLFPLAYWATTEPRSGWWVTLIAMVPLAILAWALDAGVDESADLSV